MPPPPATPAPRAASCFAKEAVRQGRPEPPPPPFQPHPSLRLRQTKGGVLRSHQPSRTQEFLIGGKVSCPDWVYNNRNHVERLWARLKEWRAIATRYEKTASSFMGVLCLAAALDWLKP